MKSRKTTTIGVLGLPRNDRGQYLLALRNDPKNPKVHQKWEIIGGGLEHGETFEECIIREAEEEIGVIPTITYPHPIVYSHTGKFKPGQHLILACYLLSLGSQIPQPNHEEILELKWIFPHQLASIDCLPLTDKFIAEAQKIHIHKQKNTATIHITGEGKIVS